VQITELLCESISSCLSFLKYFISIESRNEFLEDCLGVNVGMHIPLILKQLYKFVLMGPNKENSVLGDNLLRFEV